MILHYVKILRIWCACRTHSLKAATGLGYLLALVSGRLSSLFVSAVLASVRSDEERWSFLLLLPLAGVTAGALMSSSTPDIGSLLSPQLDSGESASLSSSSRGERMEWLWALRRAAVTLSESLATCCCCCCCYCCC